jgi:hypothetical protein
MAFPDDLLELAHDLANLHRESPHQASLRRAVSTAYYAIFHLLIFEATANWARPELRAILGRCFDHGQMKAASETKVSQINTAFKDNLGTKERRPNEPKPPQAGTERRKKRSGPETPPAV